MGRTAASRRAFIVGGAVMTIALLGWLVLAPSSSFDPLHTHHAAAATATGGIQPGAVGPRTRTYYIAAEEVDWDYAPDGRDRVAGEPYGEDADVFVAAGPGRIGTVYRKALYREYTDGSFSSRKKRSGDDAYLGILGPVIRAQVGDTVKVVFKNRTSRPASVHPHNVLYTKANEGAPYSDGTSGSAKKDDGVPPGATYTYTWKVPERAGPGPGDASSILSMYHSHKAEVGDTYAGLIGPMIITRAGWARADGSPVDVDREIVNLFQVWDENQSPYLDDNLARMEPDPVLGPEELKGDDGFGESNLMHAINGYVYGNGPMATMRLGQKVRWYEFSMGTEVDLHTPHIHGNVWTSAMGMRMDMAGLLPGEMVAMDMVADNPGIWLFHCHVNDHITAGMITRYKVVA
jgi:hephaestin